MLAYSALTWLGMLLFGRAQWLRHGEVFTLVFGLLARFAPTEVRESGSGGRALYLRPYGVGLLSREPVPASMVVLVLAMLAAVCFDGFMETPLWASILEYYAPSAQGMASDGDAARAWVQTAGVIGAPLLFVGVYLVFCRLVAWCGDARVPVARIAGLFVLTLVPIAIAYHLAHYLSFLAMAWQYLISACLRSLRFRLGLVRHEEPFHQNRTGRRTRRLVHLDRCHRDRPRDCGLPRALRRLAGVFRPAGCAAKPMADGRPDDLLHDDQPVDHRAADRDDAVSRGPRHAGSQGMHDRSISAASSRCNRMTRCEVR